MNRFWKRNSEQPFHDVTHRAIGDIPGCTMAHDVFIDISHEDMLKVTAQRAEEYCKVVRAWNTGVDEHGNKFGHREFMNHRIHSTEVPVTVIRNPYRGPRKGKDPYGNEFTFLS